MTVLVWKDKQDAHNAKHAQTSSRRQFLWRAWKCIKPAIVEAHSKHVVHGQIGQDDNKLFHQPPHLEMDTDFHLLDLSVPNSFILWCKFIAPRLYTRHHLKHAGTCKGTSPPKMPCRLPTALSSRVSHLEEASWQYWPTSAKRMKCCVCSARWKRSTVTLCKKCDVSRILGCFEEYHTNEWMDEWTNE